MDFGLGPNSVDLGQFVAFQGGGCPILPRLCGSGGAQHPQNGGEKGDKGLKRGIKD